MEDPRITRAMIYGYPDEIPDPRCPCCGNVCETIYRLDGEIIGCEECISSENANECEDCYGEF